MFSGEVSDWRAVGGRPVRISVYTRNTSSGTYSEFKELAMKKRDYAPSAQEMAGNEQIASEVGKNANGVGYVGLACTKAGGIKVEAIDGAMPSVQGVHAKTCPYARPTFYYTNGEPSGVAKAFLDFTPGRGWPENCRTGWLCANHSCAFVGVRFAGPPEILRRACLFRLR